MLTEEELVQALHDQMGRELSGRSVRVEAIVARSLRAGHRVRRRRNVLGIAVASGLAAVVIIGTTTILSNQSGGRQYAGPMVPAGPRSGPAEQDPRAITLRMVERTLARAPLPSGTRLAPVQEATGKQAQSLPADQNLVNRHATYVVPLGFQQAIAWFKGHTPPGLQPAGTSTTGGPDGTTAAGVYFAGPSTKSYTALAQQVAIYRLDASHAVVRVDGLAIWLPARTAAEQAPVNGTAVEVVRVVRAGAAPQHFTLTGSAIRQLADTLNRQTTISRATMSCPMDTGAYDILHFTGSTPNPVFRVQASGCRLITVTSDGRAQPTLNGGAAVERVLNDRLPRHK